VQNIRTAGYLNGTPSITVMIFRQPGANIIDTVDRVRAELPSIEASIPQGIKTTIVLDRTTTIRASVSDVERRSFFPSSWSFLSSSSSCATGAPRSFPPSPFPSR
jgi:multidrug efflux pump subunit AcrB